MVLRERCCALRYIIAVTRFTPYQGPVIGEKECSLSRQTNVDDDLHRRKCQKWTGSKPPPPFALASRFPVDTYLSSL